MIYADFKGPTTPQLSNPTVEETLPMIFRHDAGARSDHLLFHILEAVQECTVLRSGVLMKFDFKSGFQSSSEEACTRLTKEFNDCELYEAVGEAKESLCYPEVSRIDYKIARRRTRKHDERVTNEMH